MQWTRRAALVGAAWMIASGAALAAPRDAAFEARKPSADAREMVQWVRHSGDAAGRPFIVVDKKQARLYAFGADGRMLASTAVILGAERGDDSAPGVGDRAQTGAFRPGDRTTPAGRFETQPGVNISGEHVVWLDYEAALALHRLRPGKAHAVRAARLADSTPDQRRLSLGCVVVPVKFYLDVVQPLLGRRPGVVYVLPETAEARELITQL